MKSEPSFENGFSYLIASDFDHIYQWSPTFRLGLEYLYATNQVRNEASHDGQRLDFVLKYDLVK